MITAEEMIERAALAIAVFNRCVNKDRRSICQGTCSCKQEARLACAVAVEMCAEVAFNEQTKQLHEECGHTDEYFDGCSDVHSHLCIIATAIKG